MNLTLQRERRLSRCLLPEAESGVPATSSARLARIMARGKVLSWGANRYSSQPCKRAARQRLAVQRGLCSSAWVQRTGPMKCDQRVRRRAMGVICVLKLSVWGQPASGDAVKREETHQSRTRAQQTAEPLRRSAGRRGITTRVTLALMHGGPLPGGVRAAAAYHSCDGGLGCVATCQARPHAVPPPPPRPRRRPPQQLRPRAASASLAAARRRRRRIAGAVVAEHERAARRVLVELVVQDLVFLMGGG